MMQKEVNFLIGALIVVLISSEAVAQTIMPSRGTVPPGASVTSTISAPADAGLPYYAAVSLGTSPGIPLGDGRTIPLNPDALFFLSITGSFPTVFERFSGTLDVYGNAHITLNIPNIEELSGLTLYVAFVTVSGSSIRTIANQAAAIAVGPHLRAPLSMGFRGVASAFTLDPQTNDLLIFSGSEDIGDPSGVSIPLTNVRHIDFEQQPGRQVQVTDRLPVPLEGGSAVYHTDGKIYIIGGRAMHPRYPNINSDTIFVYDPRAPFGSRFSEYPRRLPVASSFYVAISDPRTRKIFIFNSFESSIRRNAYEFDPVANTWIEHAGVMPASFTFSNGVLVPELNEIILDSYILTKFDILSRRGSSLAVQLPGTQGRHGMVYDPVRRKVLIIGGIRFGSDEIYAYDPFTGGAPALVATLPMELRGAGAVYIPAPYNTPIYFGGAYTTGGTSPLQGSTDDIKVLASMGQSYQIRDLFGIGDLTAFAAIRDSQTNKVYVFGGFLGIQGRTDEILVIDLNAPFGSGYATRLQTRLPQPLGGVMAMSHPTLPEVYLIGGNGNTGMVRSISRFDLRTTQLTPMNNLPFPLGRAAVAWVPEQGAVYLFGGHDGISYSNAILKFDPAANGGMGQVTQVATLPQGLNAENVAFYDTALRKIFVVGFDRILEFDPFTSQVRQLPTRPVESMLGSSIGIFRGRAYLFDGIYSTTQSSMMMFDPRALLTTSLGRFPQPTVFGYGTQAMYYPTADALLVLGRFAGEKYAYLFSLT